MPRHANIDCQKRDLFDGLHDEIVAFHGRPMVAPTMRHDKIVSKRRRQKTKRNGSSGAPTPAASPHGAAVKSDLRSGEMRFAREFSSEFRMKN